MQSVRLYLSLSLSPISDDRGVGRKRAATGFLPRGEGWRETHPADHTRHPAAVPGEEGHQAHLCQGVLCPRRHGGVRPDSKPWGGQRFDQRE